MLSNPVNYITELQASKCGIWVRRLISPGTSHSQWREKISSNRQFVCLSHVPSANCPLEEFLLFSGVLGLPITTADSFVGSLEAGWKQTFGKAGVISKGSFEGVSGLKSSPSFLRELGRWGSQNFSTPKKCFGLRENMFSAEIPAQTIPSANFWAG